AVPRTPPPRSPNPSPERPRSALAAAILVTTLTGRTVAIPQPRQRSLSESDTSCLEQECFIEPYATVTELKLGPNWKHDDSERSPVQSLEGSGNLCEDENMDTYLSETEKEPEHNYQGTEKREESFSNDAVYAVPYKNKKVGHLVSFTDILFPSLGANVEKSEYHVNTVCFITCFLLSSVDVSVRTRQGQLETTKEKFQELKQENWSLINANQTMALQLEELKQQIKELQLKLKTLEKENKKCRKAAEKEVAELLSLRQQAQELVDENDGLKMTVHRLNVELSRYQTKFRPLSQDENIKIGGLPAKGPPPPWLLDMKYLSPLLLSYEDRMREKEDLNLAHERWLHSSRWPGTAASGSCGGSACGSEQRAEPPGCPCT
uniref:Centrosomal protein 89 n=1 Tax=Chelonoidis abingdonii TaxID=106734 RepID=A0A8C0H9Q0_CHEAB